MRALYNGALTSAENFRTERVDRSKRITVQVKDSESGHLVYKHGLLYKENDDFLVIYSPYWNWKEFSWASKLDFIVIPKEHVLERLN